MQLNGPLILHMLLALVHCMATNAFTGTIHLKPIHLHSNLNLYANVFDGLKHNKPQSYYTQFSRS